MATQRVSRLQKHILRLLLAEHHRTHGGTAMGHLELVKALAGDKSTISHSLRTLETRGWIVIGRTRGGRAESLDLTPAGLEKASEICTKL
jgi:DNA-binding MarR family transcriptional regulator